MYATIPRNPGRLHGLWALTYRELKKWFNEPMLLFLSIFQPLLWMGLFGKVIDFNAILVNYLGVPGDFANALIRLFGTTDYFSFMVVGMITFLAYLTTLYSGISLVLDRRTGFLGKVLSTPVARETVVLSKVLSSTIRAVVEALVVLVIALFLGFRLAPTFGVVGLLGFVAVISLLCAGLSSLFLLTAIRSKEWEPQVLVANLFSLPLLFASNALFPQSMLPGWLQVVVRINPITYATDALRQLILYPLNPTQFAVDLAYLVTFTLLIFVGCTLLSRRYLTQ